MNAAGKNSPEARLIEQFKVQRIYTWIKKLIVYWIHRNMSKISIWFSKFQAIPSNASPKRLVRKYLEFCWSLPYYGSAFFHGQIETPARSLTSLVINHDTEVLVAINSQGFYVIDPVNVVSKRFYRW